MCNFSQLSIKNQYLIILLPTVLLSFGITLIMGLVLSGEVKDVMVNEGEEALLNQIKVNSQKTIEMKGDYFANFLRTSTENFMFPYYYGLEAVIQNSPPYSIGQTSFYWDHLPSNLSHPLSWDPRYPDRMISLQAPTTFIPGQSASGDNLDTIYLQNKEYVDQSAKIFAFFPVPFEINTDFVAGYFGQNDAGVFTQFPGVSSLQTDPDRSYDPRIRPWYGDAVELSDTENYITPPYEDFSGKGWMITVSQKLMVDNVLVGVAGVDMLITEIQQSINGIKFKSSGVAHLLQTDGTVVVSPQWNPAPGDSLITYAELTNPTISDSLWEELLAKDGSREVGKYLLNTYRINDRYIIISSVPLGEIRDPINGIRVDIENDSSRLTTAALVTVFLSVVIVSLLVYCFTRDIFRTISSLSSAMDNIVDNTGSADMYAGIDTRTLQQSGGWAGTEVGQLRDAFVNLVRRGQADATSGGLVANPMFPQDHSQATSYAWAGHQAPDGLDRVAVPPPPTTSVTVHPPAPSAPPYPSGSGVGAIEMTSQRKQRVYPSGQAVAV